MPAPEKAEPRRAPKDDPDAISLRGKKSPRDRTPEPRTLARNEPRELAPNQVTVRGGQQANTPLFSPVPGSGGIGVGPGVPFGQRFGGYYAVVRDKVARFWTTAEVDPRVKTAPEVIVTFEILRDGRVRDVRLAQRSGVLTLDNSAQRAVLQAAPFPPLPPGYDRDSAVVEFWFSLKR
jgi:protein TonB